MVLAKLPNTGFPSPSFLTLPLSKSGITTSSSNQQKSAVVKLAQELIRIPSVSPNDFGCQDVVRQRLERLGFVCETMKFKDVTNMFAVLHPRGEQEGKLITFLGHTDVVPSGPEEAWTYPPFDATIADGVLYGRGAVDMKGGVASYIVALERFLENHPVSDLPHSLGVVLTSDEEGVARWGTREVLTTLQSRGIDIDLAIIGEPSSLDEVGDFIKVGRRGTLLGELTIHGVQGHVAYPHLARNPIHESLGALKDLVDEQWDEGTEDFPPTSFQISNINSGTGALNVIPGIEKVTFSMRYSPAVSAASLRARVEEILNSHDLKYTMSWNERATPFLTPRGELLDETMKSVKDIMGYKARTSTAGGSSDGRFVASTYPNAQIIELGLLNHSLHKIDEHCPVEDLERLSTIYVRLLERLLSKKQKQKKSQRDTENEELVDARTDQ